MTPHDVRCMIDQQSIRHAAEAMLEGAGDKMISTLEDSELFEFEEIEALRYELLHAERRAYRKTARQHEDDREARRWLPHR